MANTSSTPLDPGASLARISVTPTGFQIDTRGPRAARCYAFSTAGNAAEFAIALRDNGGWPLRFGRGTDEVAAVVDDLTEEDAP